MYGASGGLIEIDEVGGAKTDYIRASGMTLARIAGAAVTWLHHDHLGSAVAGTNSAGAVVWRESEQPFGEDWTTAAANDNQAGYTGHVEDAATGLVYMQARYYDPVIGRFLSIDPAPFTPGRPDMFNRYAYAANDPVNLWDPDGLKSEGGENCESDPDTGVLVCDPVKVTPDWVTMNSYGTGIAPPSLGVEPPTPNVFSFNDPCWGSFEFAKQAKKQDSSHEFTMLQGYSVSGFFGLGGAISHLNYYDTRTGLYGHLSGIHWGPGLGGGLAIGKSGMTTAQPHELAGDSVTMSAGISDISLESTLSWGEEKNGEIGGMVGLDPKSYMVPLPDPKAELSGTADHSSIVYCGAW